MVYNHLITQQQKENKIFNTIKICFFTAIKEHYSTNLYPAIYG